jgi:hypothetical protein
MAVEEPSRADGCAALHSTAGLRALAAELGGIGIPMLVLKGPLLQQRLYGTLAAYPSCDVDVLVHPGHLADVRRHLWATGWQFAPGNVLLWRLSRAAVFERAGVVLDLHWGIHAGNLPSRSLRCLETTLWDGASVGEHGLAEPAPAPLLVYLAVHAASHGFERSVWVDGLSRAAALIDDWDELWRVARRCRLQGTVQRALALALHGRQPVSAPLLDGWRGRLVGEASRAMRGHFLPRSLRAAVARGAHRFHREPA